MLVAESRPRTLHWYHSGPLLFGDWGTSRLYVLGLAFFFTAHTSVYYLLAMSAVMVAVAWAYTVICRCFPDGGGVYTSARQISPLLSVVGGTLLLCDYIVTASLSTFEAFHYFGFPEQWVVPLAIATIGVLGVVNWFGARSAGRLALIIALGAMVASVAVAALCLPFLKVGLETVSFDGVRQSDNWHRWTSLVAIMLALSGVEAVSNMTGLMVQPVERTAKRTIWPVLVEVVLFNLIFGVALAGLPALRDVAIPAAQQMAQAQAAAPPGTAVPIPPEVQTYRDTAMKVLAIESGQLHLGETAGFIFGKVCAVIFGLLLLSAANTVIVGMIAVTYVMSRDNELPRRFSRLNYSGVPALGLLLAVVAPAVVLVFVNDLQHLADLYAVGVVGAITINVLCCSFNRGLPISRAARRGLLAVGVFMLGVELTILVTKPHAALFAGGMLAAVLVTRSVLRARRARATAPEAPEPEWLAELRAAGAMPPSGPRIMLAARGRAHAEYAVDLARQRRASLFAIYVRTLRLNDVQPGKVPSIEEDPDAQQALGTAAMLAKRAGVPFFPIYVTSADIADEILDYTVTYGCDRLIMGVSERSLVSRRFAGDVVAKVAQALPEGISLILRRTDRPYEPGTASDEQATQVIRSDAR